MARPPKPGKCVHCLKSPVARNWDHVFPEAWYPDTTPPNLEKWKIPSCVSCNSRLGAIENEFLIRIAMCLDPKDPASRSIVNKAIRAWKPELAKNASDKRKRINLANRINSELIPGPQIPRHGVYPSLGERWGRPAGSGMALKIPEEHFRQITEKIVRGITYWESEKYIEPPHRIEFFALNSEGAKPILEVLETHGTTLSREPGILVRRAVALEDGMSALYEIEFWKQFKTYASVTA